MKIKRITYKEYQQLADSFLKNLNLNHKNHYPIDIDYTANLAGYSIIPICNLKRDFGIKGLVIKKDNNQFDIGIDNHHYMNDDFSYSFTIAEELGHIIGHSYIYQSFDNVQDIVKFVNEIEEQDYKRMEQQARNIASFLLLPSFWFCNYVLDYCRENEEIIRTHYFPDKEMLSRYLASKISKIINLSENTIFYAIHKRYPDPLIIDCVVDLLGETILL